MKSGFLAFLVLLAVVAAARIAELLHARRLTMQAEKRGAEPQREPVFVVMVLLHVLPFVLAPLEVVLFERPFRAWLFAFVVCAMLALAVVRIWTFATLGAMWNVRIVQPDRIVVAGPYRFVRHPNYAVVIGELFFLPLAHGCFLTSAIVSTLNAWVLSRRIPAEERMLLSLPGYREAMQQKPRFIPRLFSRRAATTNPPPA